MFGGNFLSERVVRRLDREHGRSREYEMILYVHQLLAVLSGNPP
jgi:hypothetical protein